MRAKRSAVTKNKRRMEAKAIRNIRAADRGYKLKIKRVGEEVKIIEFQSHEWFLRRNMEDYNRKLFGIRSRENIVKTIREELKSKGRVSVLDVGCGTCEFLSELGEIFGKNLELEGLTLARPLSLTDLERLKEKLRENNLLKEKVKKHIEHLKEVRRVFRGRVKRNGIRVRVGRMEGYKFGKKYDIIFSVGAIVHSANPWKVLENILNHLKNGGKAYISFGKADILRSPELCSSLKAQGIEIKRLSDDSYELKKLSDDEIKIA